MASHTRLLIAVVLVAAVVMAVTVIYAVHVRPVCRSAEYLINTTEKIIKYENGVVEKLNIKSKYILDGINKSKTLITEAENLIKENKCAAAVDRAARSLDIAEHVYASIVRKEAENRTFRRELVRAMSIALAHIYARYMRELGMHNETLIKELKQTSTYCSRACMNVSNMRKALDCVFSCYEKKLRISKMFSIMYEYSTYRHIMRIINKYVKVLNNTVINITAPSLVNGKCSPGVIEVKIGGKMVVSKVFNCSKQGVEEFYNYTRMVLARLRKIERRVRAMYLVLPMFIHSKTLIDKVRTKLEYLEKKIDSLKSIVLQYVKAGEHHHRPAETAVQNRESMVHGTSGVRGHEKHMGKSEVRR
ncbi:MAG: hypothetical protein GXO23_00710 [Crenarchaeota archaeon]|nr:hypothetical protein [Thermoproteota archaeon]